MATENKNVTIYLPADVEKAISDYCIENNITRKNKQGEIVPAIGTGIIQYLKSTLPINSPDSSLDAGFKLFVGRLERMLDDLSPLLALASQLPQKPSPETSVVTFESMEDILEKVESRLIQKPVAEQNKLEYIEAAEFYRRHGWDNSRNQSATDYSPQINKRLKKEQLDSKFTYRASKGERRFIPKS